MNQLTVAYEEKNKLEFIQWLSFLSLLLASLSISLEFKEKIKLDIIKIEFDKNFINEIKQSLVRENENLSPLTEIVSSPTEKIIQEINIIEAKINLHFDNQLNLQLRNKISTKKIISLNNRDKKEFDIIFNELNKTEILSDFNQLNNRNSFHKNDYSYESFQQIIVDNVTNKNARSQDSHQEENVLEKYIKEQHSAEISQNEDESNQEKTNWSKEEMEEKILNTKFSRKSEKIKEIDDLSGLFDNDLSTNVSSMIHQELNKNGHKIKILNTQHNENNELTKNNQVENTFDYLSHKNSSIERNEFNASVKIMNIQVDSAQHIAEGTSFEIMDSSDDRNNALYDEDEGFILLEENLYQPKGILSYLMNKNGYFPTRFNVVYEKDSEKEYNIPTLNESFLNKILEKHKIDNQFGLLLVELSSDTQNVYLDQVDDQLTKIYLDEGFSEVKLIDDAVYVLFVLNSFGHKLLKIEMKNENILNKVVSIAENELFYEIIETTSLESDRLSIFSNQLLQKKQSYFFNNLEEINSFNIQKNFKRNGEFEFERRDFIWPNSTREYLDFNNVYNGLYIGRYHDKSINIPDQNYFDYLFKQLNLNSLDQVCLMQLNFSKKVKDIQYSSKGINGNQPIEMYSLDEEGIFDQEISPMTSKVFLIGDQQAVVTSKITYLDKSVDYLQSYCSLGNMVIEEL